MAAFRRSRTSRRWDKMASLLLDGELVAQIRLIERATGRNDMFSGFVQKLESSLAGCAGYARPPWGAGAFDLRAVHDPARLAVERIAPMHGGTVVPQDQIAQRPLVPVEGGFHERPDLVQQALRCVELEPHDVRITP